MPDKLVTDPALLERLNAPSAPTSSSSSNGDKPVSDPKILEQLDPKKPEPSSRLWQVIRGGGRGIASILQSANEILPDPMELMHLRSHDPKVEAARESAKQELRKFTDAPSESGYETGGRLAGQILPFMFMPGMGATSALGSIAERAALGAVAGGLQPTEAHTAASHIPSALAGGAVSGAGRALSSVGIPLAQQLNTSPIGRKVLSLAVRGGLEYPLARGLELAGFSPREAHLAAVMIVTHGMLGGAGATAATQSAPYAVPDVTNVPGSIAARLGGAGAGAVTNEIPALKEKKRSNKK